MPTAAVTSVPSVGMEEVIPPSSVGTLVPSTVSRRSHWDAAPRNTSPSREAIESTPMKPLKYSNVSQQAVGLESAIPMSSPAMDRTWISPDRLPRSTSPVAPLRRLDFSASRSTMVQESPVKASALERMPPHTSVPQESKGEEMSIYQKLGWDDDLDDLL